MLTVLQVIPSLNAGGAERTTIEMAEALAAEGWGALVASQGGTLEGELAAAGGELVPMPVRTKNPLKIRANAGRMRRLAAARGVSLIHARSRAPAWSALWAARAARIPFITTYHGAYSGKSKLKRWYNGVMARGDIVIANSAYIRDHIIAAHRTDPARIRVIPRGVDLARFDPASVSPERIAAQRAAWDFAPDDARAAVMLPARLTFWKGHAVALEALAMLGDLDLALILLGDGQSEAAATLRGRAAAAGVADRLVIAGTEDMPAAYAASDLVLTPSTRPEAFGRTAAEAQAMQVPVIAAGHGGALEVVDDGRTGWLAAPGDAAALAAAIRRALTLPGEARAEIGRAGRARIAAGFTKAALQRATMDVYREALGHP